jgi:hypothetical protein
MKGYLDMTCRNESHVMNVPTAQAFRKAKGINRRRSLKGFFAFQFLVILVLFFDHYWNIILRALN